MSPYARSSRPVFESLSKCARLTFSSLCRLIANTLAARWRLVFQSIITSFNIYVSL